MDVNLKPEQSRQGFFEHLVRYNILDQSNNSIDKGIPPRSCRQAGVAAADDRNPDMLLHSRK